MSSVSSVNPGVADLLKSLTAINSPVLNSQKAMSALESAPTSDIVQLSSEANQLANIDTLFGLSSSSTSSTSSSSSSMSGVLQALESEGTTSTSGTSTSSVLANASPSEQAANAQALIQSELTQGLFGTGTNLTGTLFTTLG